MYRIQLSRKENNIFYIDESYVHRMRTRIMAIEINDNIVKSDQYMMKGPREVKLLFDITPNTKVFGYIMNAELGNRVFPRLKNLI